MTYNFDDYLNVVKQNIKNKKLHAPICTELESHLQDSADFYVEIGYDEVTANEKALADMGEPKKVAISFSKLHDISDAQKIISGIFIFLAAVKFIDVLLAVLFRSNIFDVYYLENSFPFFVEFFFMLLFLAGGYGLSLWTNRSIPAVMVTVLLFLTFSVCGYLASFVI